MNLDELKEKIKIALESVKDLEDPYRIEAFKIVLENLLDNIESSSNPINNSSLIEKTELHDSGDNILTLANKCNISKDEVYNVITLKDSIIEFLAPIEGTDAFQHVVGALCILLSYEIVLEISLLSSKKIFKSLRPAGIRDTGGNFATNLKKYPKLFVIDGQRYRLTTNFGREKAQKTFYKLAKREKITKEDLEDNSKN